MALSVPSSGVHGAWGRSGARGGSGESQVYVTVFDGDMVKETDWLSPPHP